jgi:hypothetical protein
MSVPLVRRAQVVRQGFLIDHVAQVVIGLKLALLVGACLALLRNRPVKAGLATVCARHLLAARMVWAICRCRRHFVILR